MNAEKQTKFCINFRFPVEKYPKETAILGKAINLLPNEVKEYLMENPVMFSAENKNHRANALFITHESFKDCKYLIHINYQVWDRPEELIIKTIFHEIGHCYLGHEPGNLSWIKSKKFIAKQENEVDRLVNKWLAKAGIEIG